MRYRMITINVMWDNEASVWIAFCDEIGLATEAESYDALLERIRFMVPEMATENHKDVSQYLIVTQDRQYAIA